MSTDSCRSAKSSLGAAREQMVQQGSAIAQKISAMVGTTWQAPAALQFKGDFMAWLNATNQMLEQLQGFAVALDAEISEWERVASTY